VNEVNDEQLGQNLVAAGIISQGQFEEVRQEAEESGRGLVSVLLEKGYATAADLATAAQGIKEDAPVQAEQGQSSRPTVSHAREPREKSGAPLAALSAYDVESAAIRAIPRAIAEEYTVLPLQISQERILVAMADETNVLAIDAIRSRTGRKVEPVEIPADQIKEAIDQYYTRQARASIRVSEQAKDLSATVSGTEAVSGIDIDLIRMLDDAPVVRIVETIVRDAARMRASDIHIEPRADHVQVRYRVDGQLSTITKLPKDMQRAVLSRIKLLANEDIAETRFPQGGRFDTIIDNRPIDLRVSTLPTYWGEKAVLRLLDKSRVFVSLSELGFLPQMQKEFEELVTRPQGMLLVTGPTGSGKSTTLYAALHTINEDRINISTVEDPIEYEVQGLNQTQVKPEIGLDFAEFLRHILRQDPDVILVGEIRDLETAQMAFRAALTGHLVLSTLHTNDAPSAVTRLVDIGIAPYIIGSSILGVLAQRLVRRICPHCREQYQPSSQELERLNLSEEQAEKIRFHIGRGCRHCRNTGYSGRVAVYELMKMNDELRKALSRGEDASALRQIAIKSGMKTLRYDALSKVHQGITSAQEAINVMFAPELV